MHNCLPLSFLSFAQVCLLGKPTKLSVRSGLQEGEISFRHLMLSLLAFEFWTGNCLLLFQWCFRNTSILLFSLFSLRLPFRCAWEFPCYQLEIGFWYQDLLHPRSLILANVTSFTPTRNDLMVSSLV